MNEDNSIDLENLYKIIIRRKKIFLTTLILSFLAGSLNLSYRRIFKPLYKGSFSLLISNPIKRESSGSSGTALDYLSLARNSVTSDIPTLKYYLKSPNILNNLNQSIIPSNIDIGLGGGQKVARGVLLVSYKEEPDGFYL